MRPPTVIAALALALVTTLTGCGADDPAAQRPEEDVPSAVVPSLTTPTAVDTPTAPEPSTPAASAPAQAPTASAPTATKKPRGATRAQIASTIEDAEEYAVQLEQVFFDQGYPRDLAGARAVARRLTNLSLAPGNTIASYVFDKGDQEFKLCVENTSGAWSTYDTRPMTTIESGKSGGCRG